MTNQSHALKICDPDRITVETMALIGGDIRNNFSFPFYITKFWAPVSPSVVLMNVCIYEMIPFMITNDEYHSHTRLWIQPMSPQRQPELFTSEVGNPGKILVFSQKGARISASVCICIIYSTCYHIQESSIPHISTCRIYIHPNIKNSSVHRGYLRC